MINAAKAGAVSVNMRAALPFSEIQCPPTTASITKMNPMAEASSTFPGLRYIRKSPMKSATGMVMAMVKVPQGLDLSAFTTISAATPSKMMRMLITAKKDTNPPIGPISSFAIWVSDFPSRRTEKSRMTKSCTHPPKTAPAKIQRVPGR